MTTKYKYLLAVGVLMTLSMVGCDGKVGSPAEIQTITTVADAMAKIAAYEPIEETTQYQLLQIM
jgi:hypothetical protein